MSEAGRATSFCPQATNRGAEMTIRVDWLAFTVRDVAPDAVQERLLEWVPGDFVELEYGSYSYARQAVGPGLGRIRWSDDRVDIHVELPGKWLGALPADKVLEVLEWVSDKAWYVAERADGTPQPRLAVTRLDLAADDFAKIVTPAEVEAAREAGNVATHAKSGSFQRDWATKGETFGLGKRGSRQYLRVYDKAAESGGEIDAMRWELQFRDEAAASALERLVHEDWGKVFMSRLVTFVDFKDRSVDGRPDRCPRLPWFVGLVGSAEKAKPYEIVKPAISAAKTLEWIRRQGGPSLAAVLEAAGGDLELLISVAKEGKTRWRGRHRVIAAERLEW